VKGPFPDGWTKDDVEAVIARSDPEELWYTPIVVSMDPPDCAWAEGVCLRLAKHSHPIVRGNAILGFGHLARRYGNLDQEAVRPLIEAALHDPDAYVRDHARTAAGDTAYFLGWHFDVDAARLSLTRKLSALEAFSFWIWAWLGTAAAGGVFGLIYGGPLGLVFGAVFAGIVAVPIHATIAIVTWAMWLSRLQVASAGLAGGLTGVVGTALLFSPALRIAMSGAMVLAGSLGALGSALTGSLRLWHFRPKGPWDTWHDAPGPWQFTLHDLFVHFTVLALLISLWTCVIRAIGH
jgi:hypothetical protein